MSRQWEYKYVTSPSTIGFFRKLKADGWIYDGKDKENGWNFKRELPKQER